MNRNVVEAIYEEVQKGNVVMEFWLGKRHFNNTFTHYSPFDIERVQKKECGTIGCIAGTACILFSEQLNHKKGIPENAAILLGIDLDLAYQVFYHSNWPQYYRRYSVQEGLERIFKRALKEGSFSFMFKD